MGGIATRGVVLKVSRVLFGGEEVLDFDGEVADTDAGGVIDGAADGGGDPGEADLSDAACAQFVQGHVGMIEEGDIDAGRIGVGRHHVVGEVAVDGRSGA
ncbi:MAG: hypothetical protein JWN14_3621, partial [Chthonomonadales bacterium]|nr:hypothetical protein [Chthonomonadales bacterium]